MFDFKKIAVAGLLALAPHAASAQSLPEGQIRVIQPYGPGGIADMMGRFLADGLTAKFGNTSTVESISGGGANIGSAEVARADADGLTLLVASESVITVNPQIYANLPYDPRADLAPVAVVGANQTVLAVNAGLGITDFDGLLALAEERPITFASGGLGTPGHLAQERLKLAADLETIYVPYRGGTSAATALLAGEVDASFGSVHVTKQNADAGGVVILAVTGPERHELLPDVPTLAELGLTENGAPLSQVMTYVVMAPTGVPADVMATLSAATIEIFETDEVKQRLHVSGIDATYMGAEDAAAWLDSQYEALGAIIDTAGITVE